MMAFQNREMTAAPAPSIVHLFAVPDHREELAGLIHREFWLDVPGASEDAMGLRLAQAARADRLPLCLVALHQGRPIGVVNLVDNDDDDHTDWHPRLAGMVVAEPWRGHGVGSALVRELLVQARRLGFERVYFGTDGPGFYTRLGAVVHEQPRPDFWFMRFDTGSG
jgi:predicted N-acetyltransferase YhbS